MSDTFTCAVCRESYEKGWADEEAQDELGEQFPGVALDDCVLVCDDCYRRMMGLPPEPAELSS